MEPERHTPVGPERWVDPSPRFQAGRFFAQKDRLLRGLVVVTLLNAAVALMALGYAFDLARRPIQFVVLDPNGNAIVAPGAPFEEAGELHVHQALLAASALLNRHPKGVDQPELLRALFTRPAWDQANRWIADEGREFEARAMEQKVHVKRVDAIGTRQGSVQVVVIGELARFGVVQMTPFVDVVPFSLRLDLQPNPDLLGNRRQPTLVKTFQLAYETNRP